MPSFLGAARRYAQAVFELAQESSSLDAWQADLTLAGDVFSDRQVAAYFDDPKRNTAEKQAVVRQMFAGKVQDQTLNLLLLLTERGRLALVPALAERFAELVRRAQGIVIARVVTAVPVDEPEQARIAAELGRMTGKRVQVQASVDPSIIGGVVAQIGDTLLDGSVTTALRQLRERLV